jgi:hypothetical protein
MSFYSGILYAKVFCGVSQVVQPWASARGQSISGSVATGHHSSGTLCKNLGNGSFADFLATISVNFIESGARQNQALILAILPIRPIGPYQSGSGRSIGTRPNQSGLARPDRIRPNRESILAMLPIEDPILVMCRLATMPKNGVLLLRCACPDEPDNCKYEYYYVSYSY